MKWILPALILLFCSFSFSDSFFVEKDPDQSYTAARRYSVDELKKDIAFLRGKYERHNPNLYLYASKPELDKYFDSLSDGITVPMTDMEFYRYIGPVTSKIKDAHTSVFPNENCEWWYGNQQIFFPLLITCNSGKIITDLCASADRTIPDGSEIVSINGKTSAEILNRLAPYAPRDGHNKTRVNWVVNNFFSYFYSYCIETDSSFEVSYIPQGETQALLHTIAATTVDSIWLNAYKFYPTRYIAGRRDSTITLRFREDSSIAILRVRSFARRSAGKDSFRKIIHDCFETIRNAPVKNLVIDVRDNSGGNPEYARYLISHLIDRKFVYIAKYNTVERLHWNDEQKRTRAQWYPYCGIGTFAPEKNCYTGKLFVLMDGGSTSTAGDFVACLDYYSRATFIGEESGANRVVSGGTVFRRDFELPNTKLRCRMSTIQGVNKTDVANDGHGVLPDYEVVPTPDDYINFRNPMLEKALELIHSK
jgi:hypothetical protein